MGNWRLRAEKLVGFRDDEKAPGGGLQIETVRSHEDLGSFISFT